MTDYKWTGAPPRLHADLNVIAERLESWFRSKCGFTDAVVEEISCPKTGAINETYLFWLQSARARTTKSENGYVLRPALAGEGPIPDVNIWDQIRTLRDLEHTSSILAPTVHFVEEDAKWLGRPFYIVSRLAGIPIFDVNLVPTNRRGLANLLNQAIDVVVQIHNTDIDRGFQHLHKRGGTSGWEAFRAIYNRYIEVFNTSAAAKPYPLLRMALEWLNEYLPRLEESAFDLVLNWGDARVGNLLFQENRITGVLDWEMAMLGPREMDVGWFLFMERFFWESGKECRVNGPSRSQMISRYERKSGKILQHLDFFERWAAFRLAVMRMRAGLQMIGRGEVDPSARPDEVNPASEALRQLFCF